MKYRAVCKDQSGKVTLILEAASMPDLLQMVWDELNIVAWPTAEPWRFSIEFSYNP